MKYLVYQKIINSTDRYREQAYSSASDSSRASTHLSAEAIQVVDTNQPIHKRVHLGLCKSLFGLHIRRGRGRPKKFKTSPTQQKITNKKGKHLKRSTEEPKGQGPRETVIESAVQVNTCQQLVTYDHKRDKNRLAYNILSDAIDMG